MEDVNDPVLVEDEGSSREKEKSTERPDLMNLEDATTRIQYCYTTGNHD